MITEKYQNRYRIKSARLPGWDYSQDGWYFVTICAQNLVCYFGNVIDGKMVLSDIGRIVFDEWRNNEIIRANIKLDEWIVMPNHLHGIIIIDNGNDFDNEVQTPPGRLYRGKTESASQSPMEIKFPGFNYQSIQRCLH